MPIRLVDALKSPPLFLCKCNMIDSEQAAHLVAVTRGNILFIILIQSQEFAACLEIRITAHSMGDRSIFKGIANTF